MKLAPEGAKVIEVLQQAGFLAYAVGGCVRDCLLGRTPVDWDVATSAIPQQVMALFPRTVQTGLKHGTVTVLIHHCPVEVTTFRLESSYSDCRRPDQVKFGKTPKEDAVRRDFTINALYWDGKGELLDFFGGQQDLKRKIIRTVGDGRHRFSEDALRILRCARFSAQLGFAVEQETVSVMSEQAHLLAKISRERIGSEWEKILMSDPVKGFSLLRKTGCDAAVEPQVAAGRDEWERCAAMPEERAVRWAALLWNSENVRDILNGFRLDKKTISQCVWLTAQKNTVLTSDYALKRLAADSSVEDVERLAVLRSDIRERFERIRKNGEFVTMNTLALTGKMLLQSGLCPEKEIGEIRRWLLDQVLLGHVSNHSANLTKKLTKKS